MYPFQVCVTRKLPGSALVHLKQEVKNVKVLEKPPSQTELMVNVRNCDGILTMLSDHINQRVIDAAGPNLRVISNYAVGYNNIDIEYATQHSIIVTHTPDVLTESTADLAWTLLMATARRVVEADHLVRAEKWKAWSPEFMLGVDIHHKTLGIIGLGRIGLAVAKRALAFNMKVLYYNRSRKSVLESRYHLEYCALEELYKKSDYISLHVPLTPETEGLIGKKELKLMNPHTILINTSRGAVIDEDALVHALKESEIRAAGLDVYNEEPTRNRQLFQLQNVVLTPHIGSATFATRSNMAKLAVNNLINALTKKYDQIKIVNPSVLE